MLKFMGMPAEQAAGYRAGALDAYGLAPERRAAEGGEPCRCCLGTIAAGEMLILLAYRPFGALQPYSETGPVFLHAEPCERHEGALPRREREATGQRILRGYGPDDRIVYGTGIVVGALISNSTRSASIALTTTITSPTRND